MYGLSSRGRAGDLLPQNAQNVLGRTQEWEKDLAKVFLSFELFVPFVANFYCSLTLQ
jgi:hypothetical protein